jgi:hypothetical protein
MAVTSTERAKATRIRRRLASGDIRDGEANWLDDYERRTSGAPSRRAPPPPTSAPAPALAPAPASTPTQDSGMVELDFSSPGTASGDGTETGSPSPQPKCTIANCPACKQESGALVCGSTGKRVWPPMSEAGAKAMASLVLAGLAFCLRFMREDRRIIPPTDREREQLAKAIREVAHRRASWVGAFDDLFALAFSLGAYTTRAIREPSQLPPPDGAPPDGAT